MGNIISHLALTEFDLILKALNFLLDGSSSTRIQESLKRKCGDDPSVLPPAKRLASVVQEGHVMVNQQTKCTKRKREEEPLDPVLPPAKRPTSAVSDASVTQSGSLKRRRDEDDVTSQSPPVKRQAYEAQKYTTSLMVLPNELLHAIVDLLETKDLQTCMQVSTIFKAISAPRYFTALEFVPRGGLWTSVDGDNIGALMVWRRMPDFVRPRQLYCTIFDPKDRHLQILQMFFCTPQCARIPVVYISFFGNTPTVCTAPLLTTIKESGCLELSFSARSDFPSNVVTSFPKQSKLTPSQLTSFSSNCNIVFSPLLVPFTMSMLHHSLLRELTLKDTGLSAIAWGRLLRTLDLSILQHFEVDSQCPVQSLLNFLRRHLHIQSLSIHSCGEFKVTPTSRLSPVTLPSLHALRGPPEYLTTLLQHVQTGYVATLLVELTKSGVPLISKVLDCTKYLPRVHDVAIYLYQTPTAIPIASLSLPKHERRTCGASQLRIMAAFDTHTDGDEDVIKYCAPWMASFPEVRTLTLVPGGVTPSDAEIEDIRQAFKKATHASGDLQIKISRF